MGSVYIGGFPVPQNKQMSILGFLEHITNHVSFTNCVYTTFFTLLVVYHDSYVYMRCSWSQSVKVTTGKESHTKIRDEMDLLTPKGSILKSLRKTEFWE